MPTEWLPNIPDSAKDLKIGVARDFHDNHDNYVHALQDLNVPHAVIDILAPDWVKQIAEGGFDAVLFHPPNDIQERKTIIDERAWFIETILKIPVYPSFRELYIYENKRNMAAFMQANDIPHVPTYVFSRKEQAVEHLKKADFPLVLKTNIGAASSGVRIIKSRAKALRIARRVFGISHPALTFGDLRFSRKFHGIPLPLFGRMQKHYLIVQDYVPLKWEWRLVRIGDSYFGKKKLLEGGYASGSGSTTMDCPPLELFHLTRDICDKAGFRSMNIDIFETTEGEFLVNELQAIFGPSKPHQMVIDGKPGRYILRDGNFEFESGIFNQHGNHLLRVHDLIHLLLKKKADV